MRRARYVPPPSASSARPLRPLIFLVVSLFLVLLMIVYNFFTLDFSRIPSIRGAIQGEEAAEPLPDSLTPCASITLDELQSSEATIHLRQRCFTAEATVEVPDLVHFVYLPVQMVPLLDGETAPPPENFTMVHYAAVESVRKSLKPSIMVLHYPATEPQSEWYAQCQRHFTLHRVVFPQLPANKPSTLSVYQRRDIFQVLIALRALRKQGGIVFSDFNTFVLRPMAQLLHLPLLLSRSKRNRFNISPAMLVGGAENKYIVYLEKTLLRMLEQDDHRLHTIPIDRLLGVLLLEKPMSWDASEEPKPNIAVTARRVFDGLPPHQLSVFLSSSVSHSSVHLPVSAGFRLPPHYPLGQDVQADEAYTQLLTLQTRINSLQELAADQSLLAAVMRLSTSTNTTAELDSVLGR